MPEKKASSSEMMNESRDSCGDEFSRKIGSDLRERRLQQVHHVLAEKECTEHRDELNDDDLDDHPPQILHVFEERFDDVAVGLLAEFEKLLQPVHLGRLLRAKTRQGAISSSRIGFGA
jgi:hypothetical protein